MNISRENIEQYLLDYAEGRLSPARAGELLAFLSANPDLMPLLEQCDPGTNLDKDVITFPGKDNLKKDIRPTANISAANADDWMIASIEGLLSQEEEEELTRFISLNPGLQYDMDKYRASRLTADTAITFPAKQRLRKKTPLLPLRLLAWTVPAAAAAVVMLFIAIRFFTGSHVEQPVDVTGMESYAGGTESLAEGTESLPGEIQIEENQQIETQNTKHETRNKKQETRNTKHSLAATITGTPSLSRIESRSTNPLLTSQSTAVTDFSPEEKSLSHPSAFTPKDQPLIARAATGFFSQVGNQIREILPANGIPKPKFDLWSVAKAGVKGYNSMTDRDLELLVEKDEEGNVIYYALKDNDQVLMKRAPGRE